MQATTTRREPVHPGTLIPLSHLTRCATSAAVLTLDPFVSRGHVADACNAGLDIAFRMQCHVMLWAAAGAGLGCDLVIVSSMDEALGAVLADRRFQSGSPPPTDLGSARVLCWADSRAWLAEALAGAFGRRVAVSAVRSRSAWTIAIVAHGVVLLVPQREVTS